MKHLLLTTVALSFSYCVYAACPVMSCPVDRDTPVAEYLFENNLLDTSGHGLHAIENNPSRPVTYHNNIGGRPGYCAANFTFSSQTGAALPACIIFSGEGEIEWYHYITNPASAQTNTFFTWNAPSGVLGMYPGDGGLFGMGFFRLGYSYWNGAAIKTEEYAGEWIRFNQWQHCSFQWGAFGTRLIIDGIMVAGSYNQWYQGARDNPYIVIGTWQGPGNGFYGYIDDLRFWPCSGHGTPTVTATITWTKTSTVTATPTITPTFTVTETHTITETHTTAMTCTVTETASSSATPTISFTHTLTSTPTPSPSVTLTPTASPTTAETRFFGMFPNPAAGRAKFVFSTGRACRAELTVFTVSGEKAGNLSLQAGTGINLLEFPLNNPSGIKLSSGVYVYRLELFFPGKKEVLARGNFSVVK